MENVLSEAETRPEVLFLLSFGRGAPLAAGRDTSAHSMISLAGGNNVMAEVSGYKAITPEAIIATEPEIVVVLQRTFALYGDKEQLFSLPELATTPAAKQGRLSVFDGLYLIGFGPRTIGAIRDLAAEFPSGFIQLQGCHAVTVVDFHDRPGPTNDAPVARRPEKTCKDYLVRADSPVTCCNHPGGLFRRGPGRSGTGYSHIAAKPGSSGAVGVRGATTDGG